MDGLIAMWVIGVPVSAGFIAAKFGWVMAVLLAPIWPVAGMFWGGWYLASLPL